ncbi:hypothetical protein H2200_000628 [Cladophialophora chaetospira]|uniref:BZIP domain-containing protein n=1 Tax=Cladophialophora chaetospira TaxID=386627 RepID=A0AA38XNU0_9EURO|nr:hypothetical protein H2200_000628 [Cladophialophora chaetospira]
MDHIVAYQSSSTSSPATVGSNESRSKTLNSQPQFDESHLDLDSLWLNDDPQLFWDLDISQDFAAAFDQDVSTTTSNAAISESTTQASEAGMKRRGGPSAADRASKRREQNRAAQRQFRERKIHYVRGIEQQLEELNERYQDLVVSFNNQTREKIILLSKIARLTAQLAKKD